MYPHCTRHELIEFPDPFVDELKMSRRLPIDYGGSIRISTDRSTVPVQLHFCRRSAPVWAANKPVVPLCRLLLPKSKGIGWPTGIRRILYFFGGISCRNLATRILASGLTGHIALLREPVDLGRDNPPQGQSQSRPAVSATCRRRVACL